jgi:hypothetical protein
MHMPLGKVASAASLGTVAVAVPTGTVLPVVVLTALVGGVAAVVLGLVVSPVVDGAEVVGADVDGAVMGAVTVVTRGAPVRSWIRAILRDPRSSSGARPNAVVTSVLRAMPSMSSCDSAGEPSQYGPITRS